MRLGFAALRVLSRPTIQAVSQGHFHINFWQSVYVANFNGFYRSTSNVDVQRDKL